MEEPIKFEGILALINQRFDDMKVYNKERFDQLHAHNMYQNGGIKEALNRIADLETESEVRGSTCKLAVEAFQKKTETQERHVEILRWMAKRWYVLFIAFIGLEILVVSAIHNGWIAQLIELIIKLKS